MAVERRGGLQDAFPTPLLPPLPLPLSPSVSGCQDAADHHGSAPWPASCSSYSLSFGKPTKISPKPPSRVPKHPLPHVPSRDNPGGSPAHLGPFAPSSAGSQQGCALSLLQKPSRIQPQSQPPKPILAPTLSAAQRDLRGDHKTARGKIDFPTQEGLTACWEAPDEG